MPERYLGQMLGKYRIDELIGSGGFAWVYRGYDPELEIPVAIKVLKPQFAGDKNFEERFRREASTAARLRHPNIIKIYSVGRDGDAVYFVMDYLPSGLADKLEKTPFLPEEIVLQVGADVARALGFAHREGVIHRDIKIDNIMFDVHGNAIVTDFGIARAVSGYTQQTGTNMVVGTPQYFAPEQARAKQLDGRADIYSLGVTLFRAATGRLPFEGDDWYEIARQHVEEAPPSPRSINSAISPPFERLVLQCLAKHPDDRPATGEVLADELAVLQSASRSGKSHQTLRVTPSDAPTMRAPGRGRVAPRPAPWRILVPAALVLVALSTIAFPVVGRIRELVSRDTTPVAAAPAESTVVAFPPFAVPLPDSPVVVVPGDLQRATPEAARRDSSPRPVSATVARLVVSAPAEAHVSVNGVAAGDGGWRGDSLKPGDYAVAATIESLEGCPTARVEQSLRLRAGQLREVALNPRGCGSVSIDGQPAGAFFVVTSADGSVRREGTLPLASPLILPAGQYRITAQKPQCAPYEQESITLAAGQVLRIPFRLICATP